MTGILMYDTPRWLVVTLCVIAVIAYVSAVITFGFLWGQLADWQRGRREAKARS